jgi:hypothetical protein
MQGFGEVQDSRILSRQPVRLALQPVSRPAPFQELIPRNLPAPLTPQDVAIMNQVDLKQEVSAGRIVKVPSGR